jgi:hypothetical protein
MNSRRTLGAVMLGLSVLTLPVLVAVARAACPTNVSAALDAACPCSGPAQGGAWKNHGGHQSCVVHFRNDLRRQGCLTAQTQQTIASCSARSTCGKANAMLCCKVTGTGTCAIPAGGTTGTCTNNAAVTCSTDADCTVLSAPKIAHDAALCTARGGYSSGTGSVCDGCAVAVACCVPSSTAGQSTCAVLSAAYCTAQGGSSTAGAAPTCTGVTCP